MMYRSTRGRSSFITSSEAIIRGIAEDGGLYIPACIPKIDISFSELSDMSYKQAAAYILGKFLTDFSEDELKEYIGKAYDEKFTTAETVALTKADNAFFLELYHGPTLAFKDMALSLLPYLLKGAMKKNAITKELVILTATSGDTGKAALEGFAGVAGTKIVVFYPQEGVSEIQKRQMITQEGENTLVVGIRGNFDDAQNGVKAIFNDSAYRDRLEKKGYLLSSANSINIGRLIPQLVYYFFAYARLVRNSVIIDGEKINIAVPTGNFGNILAAFYAKEMGLPVNKLICASNENNILYDFIRTGVYDMHRSFKTTVSPSMDILISSNLERLLYYISGEDGSAVEALMNRLEAQGKYEISKTMKKGLKEFWGGYADDEDTLSRIREVYGKYKYIIDTHTAVAYSVYKQYAEATGDSTVTVIASTASPFKFTRSVCGSLDINSAGLDDFELLKQLSDSTGLEVPPTIKGLESKNIVHDRICGKEEMMDVVNEFLKV
ncbi:MAG: threonine synthase [Bacillota bacterium]